MHTTDTSLIEMPQEIKSRISADHSIAARIAAHAAATPDRAAIFAGLTQLTFAELEEQSNRLATQLIAAGAGPEVCVGLLLERSPQFVIAALAVLKSGAAYLPLDSSTPAQRAAHILTDAAAPLLISHRDKSRALPAGAWRVIDLDHLPEMGTTQSPALPVDPPAESLAYVIYTSGSTGVPKGVEITHANLLNLIDWHQAAFTLSANDRASQIAGLAFDAAGWEIWPTLTAGASLHFADEVTRRSSQGLHDWLLAEKITISFVPTMLAEQLLSAEWPGSTTLRTLLTGADTLHRRPPAGLPFTFVNNYGPTECTVVATSGVVSAQSNGDSRPSIGRAIANTTVLILDEGLRPVPFGQPGELCLTGAHVGRGYRNNPKLTADKFVSYASVSGEELRIYRTGDRAQFLEGGEIAFLGRLDDQIKIRGYRIEPGEIVASIGRHPGVKASSVIVRDGPEQDGGGPALAAYVVAAAGAKLTARELRDFLAARLPDYMIPLWFVAVESLPMTTNGKLDKTALPAPGANNLLPDGNPVVDALPAEAAAPTAGPSEVEKKVSAMVASLLGQPSVKPADNFFMLGGHSMLGVQLVARIKETFSVKLSLRELFGAPTVSALTAAIERLAAAAKVKAK